MRRKELLSIMSGVPGWVRAKYGAASVMPDVAADFIGDRYWDRRFGPQTLAQMFAVLRASEACADDTSGSFVLFPSGVTARTNKGLHTWEGSTNSLRNNSMQGANVGGDLLPTNWTYSSASGVSRSVVGLGTENGMEYIDIQFSSISVGSTAVVVLSMETVMQIAAVSGQTWTFSAYLKLIAGSFANISTFQGRIQELDSGGSGLVNNAANVPTASVNSSVYYRHTQTATLAQPSCAFTRPQLVFTPSAAGVAVDFTLRIAWPQFEQKAFATPPIRTTTTATTRAADVIVLANSPAFGGLAATLFAAATARQPTSAALNQGLLMPSDGSTNNRFGLFRSTSGQLRFLVVQGAAAAFTQGAASFGDGVTAKAAAAFQSGDSALYMGGLQSNANATEFTWPATAAVQVGNVGGGSSTFDGEVRDIAIWSNTRLPNAALQAITAST
jgi:hypothetical protein